jgi:outer membrane immunogenic protein
VPPETFTESRAPEIEALGSIRARLGWSPIDSVLFYGTAGLGWERISTVSGFASSAPAGSLTSSTYNAADRFGWVGGAGAEILLPGGNWIGRLEYLHYGFGAIARSGVITNTAGTTLFGAGDHGVDVLRAGVSYKFGDPATAVPVRYAKAPLLAPSSGWAGFYLGGHAGYGSHDDDFTEVIDFTSGGQTGGIKSRGWLGGGHGRLQLRRHRRGVQAGDAVYARRDPDRHARGHDQISGHGAHPPWLVAGRQRNALRHRRARLGTDGAHVDKNL